MKKSRIVLGSLAVALLGVSAAFAVPPGPPAPRREGPGMPPPPPPRREDRAGKRMGIFERAPEDIKSAWLEMRSLRKDLRLELCKDKPDAAKAMEMFKKAEELHAKVNEWHVRQILEGNAPKPELEKRPPRDRRHGPGKRGGPDAPDPRYKPRHMPAPFRPGHGGCFVPGPGNTWTWVPYDQPAPAPEVPEGEEPEVEAPEAAPQTVAPVTPVVPVPAPETTEAPAPAPEA